MPPAIAAGVPTLIGVPYDGSSSHLRGSAEAPPLIRAALHSPATNLWTEALADLGAPDALDDAGDLRLDGDGRARAEIERGIDALLRERRRPIALGGDHSITYSILRAVRPFCPELTVLQLDAHPDLYADFDGDRFSHACPFARAMEERLADRLVQVGIRAMNGHQRDQAERLGVELVDMAAWTAGRCARIATPVYVSIDVDALDPAFAPGVSHREPGGLSVREVLGLLHSLDAPIVGADVVEFNPRQDPLGLTAPVCAKLVKELAGRMGETTRAVDAAPRG